MIPLRCCTKNFDWGQLGSQSIVGRIVKAQDPGIDLNESTPFAELWMGTHPSGPSVLADQPSQTLLDYLKTNPNQVGSSEILTQYGPDLPFLFKVLSVKKALSIQAHPNKALAKELHARDPKNYPDENHKPEMSIALTEFEAFCGFRQHFEITFLLEAVPEFREAVGTDLAKEYLSSEKSNESLRKLFTGLMNAPRERIQKNLENLKNRWSGQDETNLLLETQRELFLRLSNDFPGDIGLFGVFFLNYLVMKPGEAIFIGADEPHAYISGDCIEAMACSDNVVRAGLTPKFKDVSTLCSMLTYITRTPLETLLDPIRVDQFTKSYIVPTPEFIVDGINVKMEQVGYSFEYEIPAKESGSILVVISGEATGNGNQKLESGFVGFLPAGVGLKITDVKEDLLIYRAYGRL